MPLQAPNKEDSPNCYKLIDSGLQFTIKYVDVMKQKDINDLCTADPNPVRLTGNSLKSQLSKGKTCFHYREPLFSLQFLYSLQGISCENYYRVSHSKE